jgi:ribosomal peptide maturation radical SAM protein 1
MHERKNNVLLVSLPFAGLDIPSIQLSVLETYLKQYNLNIKSKHLYLKAADFYHINNYNNLIYPPNDSYTAQIAFTKFVFPEHWEYNKEKIKEYFDKINSANNKFSFEDYIQSSEDFFNWTIENIDWQPYELIGFTLNYGQFLPSLALSKKLKQLYPEKKIIFGGSRTTGELGKRVLQTFDFVDYIVSGEGEEPLCLLASNNQSIDTIPNLIYRKENNIIWNSSDRCQDLNNLPLPSYDSFYESLESCSTEIQQFFQYYGRLPIEISRGCWWNRCTFCNLNLQYNSYREKCVDKIIEEIQFLASRYKMLSFQIIGNTLPKNNYRDLFERIKHLGKDFSFVSEARAGILKSNDYVLLKQAGFDIIQTGIESFSQSYLKKMNKGARVIDNIAALKFCRENGISNKYNLIIDYPNEDVVDFQETVKNVELFKQYLEPPQICYLKVLYNSPIQCNPDIFNIEKLDFSNIDKLMFPDDVLDMGFNFIYDFKRKVEKENFNWKGLIEDWKKIREKQLIRGAISKDSLEELVFYFVDGGKFLKIFDKRVSENIQIYVLNDIEREVFLSCIDVISFKSLKERLPHITENQLLDILRDFQEIGIIFNEDNVYLSLPLSYSKVIYKSPEIRILTQFT